MKSKLDEVIETTGKMKEKLDIGEEMGKEVVEEDVELELDPPVQEEPFL